jgi:hypothetical protein
MKLKLNLVFISSTTKNYKLCKKICAFCSEILSIFNDMMYCTLEKIRLSIVECCVNNSSYVKNFLQFFKKFLTLKNKGFILTKITKSFSVS